MEGEGSSEVNRVAFDTTCRIAPRRLLSIGFFASSTSIAEFMSSLTECPYTVDIKCIVKCASRFIITLAFAYTSNKTLARIPFRRQCVEHLEHVQGC